MAKRLRKEHVRKIQFSNGTYYVTLPMNLVRSFEWKEQQKVAICQSGKQKMLLREWSEHEESSREEKQTARVVPRKKSKKRAKKRKQ